MVSMQKMRSALLANRCAHTVRPNLTHPGMAAAQAH